MKMATGFLAPTAGTAIVCGHDILRQPLAAKRGFGYLPEGAPAYPDMIVAAFLRFVAHIRGFRGEEATARVDHIVELVHLGEVYDQRIDTLSKGFRRRVGVAQALIHDPPVIILDEPTDGLDPNQKHEMRRIIAAMRPKKAIVISTHLLEEVEAVCTRAVIIAKGRLLADATPAELAARSRYHNAVRIAVGHGNAAKMRAELDQLDDVAAVETAEGEDGVVLLVLARDGRPIAEDIADLARARRWRLGAISVERGRLDDVFRAITAPESAPRPPWDLGEFAKLTN